METANTFIHYRSSLENPTQFQTKKGKLYTLLKSIPVFRPGLPLSLQKLCHLLRLEREQKDLLKCISVSHISLSFFFIWNRNDRYVRTLPLFPRKPYPIPDKSMTLTGGLSHICFIGADVFAGKKVNLLAKPLKPPAFLYICQPSLHDCDMELPNFNRPL